MVLNANNVLPRIAQSVQETSVNRTCTLRFQALGTKCQVICSAQAPAAIDRFKQEMLLWMAGFEARYSRFIPESLISRINAQAGRNWVEIDPETEQLFALCNELFFLTRGAFDPTTLPLLKLWNWKSQAPVLPTDAQVNAARALVGWRQVQFRNRAIFLPQPGMGLDLGGIGKEYAVDRVIQLAQIHGLHSVLVDFGQDIRVSGSPPGLEAWHIGLEDPMRPGLCWTGVALRNEAVATSGDYLRHFEVGGRRYGHIIDPRTGYPVNNDCRAVTVIAAACTVAGLLSTAAFILGPQEGLSLIQSYFGAEGCIVTENSRFETRKFHGYVTQQTQTRVA